jgi:acyl carrier protein
MRDRIIDILNMVCPYIDTDEEFNLIEDMEEDDFDAFIDELEQRFRVEIGENERSEENFESIDAIIEMIESLQ